MSQASENHRDGPGFFFLKKNRQAVSNHHKYSTLISRHVPEGRPRLRLLLELQQ